MNKDDIADWLSEPVTQRFMERCGFLLRENIAAMHGCVVSDSRNQAALAAGRVEVLQYILSAPQLKEDLADEKEETESDDG